MRIKEELPSGKVNWGNALSRKELQAISERMGNIAADSLGRSKPFSTFNYPPHIVVNPAAWYFPDPTPEDPHPQPRRVLGSGIVEPETFRERCMLQLKLMPLAILVVLDAIWNVAKYILRKTFWLPRKIIQYVYEHRKNRPELRVKEWVNPQFFKTKPLSSYRKVEERVLWISHQEGKIVYKKMVRRKGVKNTEIEAHQVRDLERAHEELLDFLSPDTNISMITNSLMGSEIKEHILSCVRDLSKREINPSSGSSS